MNNPGYRLDPTNENLQQVVTLIEKHPSLRLLQQAKEQIDAHETYKHDAPLTPNALP